MVTGQTPTVANTNSAVLQRKAHPSNNTAEAPAARNEPLLESEALRQMQRGVGGLTDRVAGVEQSQRQLIDDVAKQGNAMKEGVEQLV